MTSPEVSVEHLQGRVGQEIGCSSWIKVEQQRINLFADATDDHQFIHIDPEQAAQTPFGKTIAHGFLVLSLLSKMAGEVVPRIEGTLLGLNYGFERVRFLMPVSVGSRIRGRFRLADLKKRSEKSFIFTHEVTVEIENLDKPALIANWLYMIELS